jgi:hypothetical protein
MDVTVRDAITQGPTNKYGDKISNKSHNIRNLAANECILTN